MSAKPYSAEDLAQKRDWRDLSWADQRWLATVDALQVEVDDVREAHALTRGLSRDLTTALENRNRDLATLRAEYEQAVKALVAADAQLEHANIACDAITTVLASPSAREILERT